MTKAKLNAYIEKLRTEYGKHERITTDSAIKLGNHLDKADDYTIRLLAVAGIKFVSVLAMNRVRARRLAL